MARPAKPKTPPDPELGDIPDRLKELSSRLAQEKSTHAAQEKPPVRYQGASNYSKATRLMSEFVAGILVGGLVGYGLDYFSGTSPFLFVLFILLGFGAGMLNMVRTSKKQMDGETETTGAVKNTTTLHEENNED